MGLWEGPHREVNREPWFLRTLLAQTQVGAELPGTSAPLPLPHIHTLGADNSTCEVCSLFLLSMPAQAALTCPDSHPPTLPRQQLPLVLSPHRASAPVRSHSLIPISPDKWGDVRSSLG